MPAISVIVPIYNVEGYLEECLESIACQSFSDFEALCVIDGSEDGSLEIARRMVQRDGRFKVLEKGNGGLSSARNFGIDHAGGDIVVFVDGDDTIAPKCLERVHASMQDAEVDVLVFGANLVPSEAATEWLSNCLSPIELEAAPFSLEFMFSEHTTPYVWRTAVRRALLVRQGVRFDEGLPFGEDVVFQFASYPRARKLASIPDKIYNYRLDRSGSLMDEHRGNYELMKAHASIVEAVFRSWEELGLLERYPQELFEWSIPYLLRTVDQVTPAQRDELFSTANALWKRYFPHEGSCAARVSTACMCRGDGKLYVECVVNAAPFDELDVVAYAGGREVPAGTYRLSRCDGGREQVWALELPWLAVSSVKVLLRPDGRACEQASVSVRYRSAKWLSRINYRLRADRCFALRDIEQSFTSMRFQVSIDHRFHDGRDALWRFRVRWIGPGDAKPRFTFVDGAGAPISLECVLLESRRAPAESLRENLLFISVRVPAPRNHFVMSVDDDEGKVAAGFIAVDPTVDRDHCAGSAEYMRSAGSDNAAYTRWLEGHRAKGGELDAQRMLGGKGASFCVVVDAVSSDYAACEETLRSLVAQTYERWEAVVLGLKAPDNPEEIPEGYRVWWRPDARVPMRFDDATALVEGEYCLFLDAGDTLEPDALFSFAEKASGACPVIYGDEDVRSASGEFCEPKLKTRLNLDLLYSSNWMGKACALRRELLQQMPCFQENDLAVWLYDRVLRAYEAGAQFEHVPRVVLHALPAHSAEDGGASDCAVLADHLGRRGLAADVVACEGGRRIRYRLPEEAPLVSVIIPSKDQADLLEACVRSLVERSSYRAFEIIVVENNSEQHDTAERYAALENDFPQVRIVHWSGDFNYSGIINFGVSQARGELLLLLNNDTELIEPDSLAEMVGILQRPEVGVVGAKLLFKDGLVQHAGITVGPSGAVSHVNQNRGRDDGGYQNRACLVGDYTAVTGACQMVRREVFEEAGRYDERFAVGFNDVDFCMRLQQKGYLVVFTPYALFYHYEFASRGREVEGDKKMLRWKRESAQFIELWPIPSVEGDPYTSPHLMRDGIYYQLS